MELLWAQTDPVQQHTGESQGVTPHNCAAFQANAASSAVCHARQGGVVRARQPGRVIEHFQGALL